MSTIITISLRKVANLISSEVCFRGGGGGGGGGMGRLSLRWAASPVAATADDLLLVAPSKPTEPEREEDEDCTGTFG